MFFEETENGISFPIHGLRAYDSEVYKTAIKSNRIGRLTARYPDKPSLQVTHDNLGGEPNLPLMGAIGLSLFGVGLLSTVLLLALFPPLGGVATLVGGAYLLSHCSLWAGSGLMLGAFTDSQVIEAIMEPPCLLI